VAAPAGPHHSGAGAVRTTEHEFPAAATAGERRAATVGPMATATQPTATPTQRAPGRLGGRWIDDWRPEDVDFWESTGRPVARRNLFFSVFSEHVGFSVWSLWSVVVLFLPEPVFGIDPAGKFLLTTLPTALGAFVRLPYTFAVAKFGGRNWTIISASLLLVPTIATAIVLEPGVDYSTLLIVSCLAGVGGGNFASSMTNINAFYPTRLKGWALGLNAGGGNLGVPVIQLIGLLVLATAGVEHPRIVLFVYLPLIVVAAVGAALLMDNLTTARNQPRAMREAAREGHTWILSFLYIGTFGSFIGFGFAFGQVLQNQFAEDFATPLAAAQLTWLGPLLGSLIRPLGGSLADRFGGARITFWNFIAMAVGASVVLAASQVESLPLFLLGFVLLFVLSGLGNGSTYKMIPAVFRTGTRCARPGRSSASPGPSAPSAGCWSTSPSASPSSPPAAGTAPTSPSSPSTPSASSSPGSSTSAGALGSPGSRGARARRSPGGRRTGWPAGPG
jgi:NNP family nitrate/nitrite transporter-like MFS transporter